MDNIPTKIGRFTVVLTLLLLPAIIGAQTKDPDALIRNISNHICTCVDSKIEKSKKPVNLDKVFSNCLLKSLSKERSAVYKQNFFNDEEFQNAVMLDLGLTCPRFLAASISHDLMDIEEMKGGTLPGRTVKQGKFVNAYYDEFYAFEFEEPDGTKSRYLVLEFFEGCEAIMADLLVYLDREMEFEVEERWVFSHKEKKFIKFNMIVSMNWQ